MFLPCMLNLSTKLREKPAWFLVEVDRSLLVVVTPGEVRAKEPLNHTHELHPDESRQDALEARLDVIAARKVDKVIYIQNKGEGHGRVRLGGVIRIADKTRVDAWIAWVALEAHGSENPVNHVVPVTWAAAQSIEGLLEEPELVLGR